MDITDTTSSESKKIATIFSANNKGKETLKSGKDNRILNDIADFCFSLGDPNQSGMFGAKNISKKY